MRPSFTADPVSARTRSISSASARNAIRHQPPEFSSSAFELPFFQRSITAATSIRKTFSRLAFFRPGSAFVALTPVERLESSSSTSP